MNIAYSCNDFYVPQTGISIISLLENNKSFNEIIIYLISKNISKNNLELLNAICNSYDRTMIVIPFEQIAFDLKLSNTGRHIETVYSKIFFSRIKGLHKCLYIDSDTIIVDSLMPLWNIDISNVYLAAVETFTLKNREDLGIKPETIVFNDGMTLMNVDYCRENKLIDKSLHLIDKFEGNPPVLSEGVLNSICQDKVKFISLRYNLMAGMYQIGIENSKYLSTITSYSQEDIESSCQHPVIIHYLSAYYNRPWSKKCTHPLKHFYLKYKLISPWKDQELTNDDLPIKQNLIRNMGKIIGITNILKISNFKHSILNLMR